MAVRATRKDANDLLIQGALALVDAEEYGIRLDVPYLKAKQTELAAEIETLKRTVDATEEGKIGITRYGRATWDCSNNNHVAWALEACGHDLGLTDKGRTKTDAEALQAVGGDFVDGVMRIRKLEKIRNTYIAQWLREEVDGVMHPVFNLHTAVTYRSSSDSPNFQNIPRRDKEAQSLLRTAILPSKGRRLVEVDYGAMEVRIIACYTEDKNLMEYIVSGADMHKDVASWDFALPSKEITKELRDMGKNGATFPRFYGSWHKSIADNHWKRILAEDPKTASGTALRAHVKNRSNLGNLVEAGEKKFWNKFSASRTWQDQWVKDYEQKGYFDMLTGFRCAGSMSRNQLYNSPVQGSAFHCLLWAFIELNGALLDDGFDSRCIGQIHDSIVLDVVPEEFDDVIGLARQIMTEDIREEWTWINVPLLAEVEATPVDGPWNTKKEIKL